MRMQCSCEAQKCMRWSCQRSCCAIARAGAGVNNIPLEKCADQGIVVFNTPGANANGVKELVFAGMLLAARDIIGGANWVTENQDSNADVAAGDGKGKEEVCRTVSCRAKSLALSDWARSA